VEPDVEPDEDPDEDPDGAACLAALHSVYQQPGSLGSKNPSGKRLDRLRELLFGRDQFHFHHAIVSEQL